MSAAERQYLLDVLDEHKGVVLHASKAAGICRQQFYKKLQRHGINSDQPQGFGNAHWRMFGAQPAP